MNYGFVRFLSCFIPNKQKRHEFIAKYRPRIYKYGNKDILSGQESQNAIIDVLRTDKPCLVCRFGLNEFDTLYAYLNKKAKYKDALKKRMYTGAGFFPADNENLSRFSEELRIILSDIDILAAWHTVQESKVCTKYCSPDIQYISLGCLSDITLEHPWTSALKDKKILVIHPFEDSIKSQYERRNLLFTNPEILPDFELITMKPVQSMADNKSEYPYKTWFEALDAMKEQISKIDFDIALIGAGAYGIFLADYCKRLGKKAVHVGGATQILFGIKGKRWEQNYPNIAKIMNEHWVRPLETEKPKGMEKVEGGCYW